MRLCLKSLLPHLVSCVLPIFNNVTTRPPLRSYYFGRWLYFPSSLPFCIRRWAHSLSPALNISMRTVTFSYIYSKVSCRRRKRNWLVEAVNGWTQFPPLSPSHIGCLGSWCAPSVLIFSKVYRIHISDSSSASSCDCFAKIHTSIYCTPIPHVIFCL